MTYVEFFDKTAVENVAACLTHAPARVVFIGEDKRQMQTQIERYQRVFAGRGCEVECIAMAVDKADLSHAVELLCDIVETYDNCVFDITGGSEILLLALGIVCERYPDEHIQIHKFNLRNNMLYDCDEGGQTVRKVPTALSVEENIRIYGGEVVYGDVTESKTYRWEISPEFAEDVQLMWGICKDDVRAWNAQIGFLSVAEKLGEGSADGLSVTVLRSKVVGYLQHHGWKDEVDTEIMGRLLQCGLLTAFEEGENLTVSYKNAQVKRCLTKAGQALEMKVFLAARAVHDGEGRAVYGDVLNGVTIDWDGCVHEEGCGTAYDTVNEMDVLLMHGVIPVFISCKNGTVAVEELYKLHTVAERFGGAYAKKVLVTTALDDMGEAGEYLRQRARDMKIRILDGVQDLEDAEWESRLRSLWSN